MVEKDEGLEITTGKYIQAEKGNGRERRFPPGEFQADWDGGLRVDISPGNWSRMLHKVLLTPIFSCAFHLGEKFQHILA